MTELDDRLREHYAGLLPRETFVEALLRRAREDTATDDGSAAPRGRAGRGAPIGRGRTDGRRGWTRLLARRAGRTREGGAGEYRGAFRLALGAVCVAVVAIAMHGRGSLVERTERTLREVAMNHATRLTFEFEGESIAALDRDMRQLPFALEAPARLGEDLQVLGSRYCSLGGRLAAHVKLLDGGGGTPVSLFVTAAADELEGLDGGGGEVDGVGVSLWREGGLFYAMAEQGGGARALR